MKRTTMPKVGAVTLALLAALAMLAVWRATRVENAPEPASVVPPGRYVLTGSPPPSDPSFDARDASGRTPAQVVLKLIEALNAREWATCYSLYATPEVDFTTASKEWASADERYAKFTVGEQRVVDEANALVNVTYEASTTAPNGERYPVIVGTPDGEWWALHKIAGVWKVRWLPRQ